MTFTVRLFGIEFLHIDLSQSEAPSPASEGDGTSQRGDCTTSPVGFAGWTEDTRWQPGGEP